ncbi:uncharacterized protein [Rutidosis leptorrhynchoides]|uniref:uncharacterized protein n=1 Tax=Rutidosis leptorrhynchoides TaxID=125765 RepID=UPI003A994959
MWVKWIHSYKLPDRNVSEVDNGNLSSYAWGKLLSIRRIIRPFIIQKVGNGERTSTWYDTWCDFRNLGEVISFRDITREGLNAATMVCDLISHNGLKWPYFRIQKYPLLPNISFSDVSQSNRVCWKLEDESLGDFSTKNAWESPRPQTHKVPWYSVVWFAQNIPRYECTVWLMIGEKLKTQEKLMH